MLETARIEAASSVPQECSSIGRAPVSKTGGRRFEPCHSCQRIPPRSCRLSPCFPAPSDLDLWPLRQYIAATCSRPVNERISGAAFEIPEQSSPVSGSSFKREGWANGGCSVPLNSNSSDDGRGPHGNGF